jgi:hypothetical protein
MNKFLLLQFFIPLLMAHLLADFAFQPDSLVKAKTKWYWRATHSFIHATLTYVLLAQWTLWYAALLIGVLHFFIDWGKQAFTLKKSKNTIMGYREFYGFIWDQVAHILILIGAAFWLYSILPTPPMWEAWLSPTIWNFAVIFCAFILLIPCGGKLIELFMQPFQDQLGNGKQGLKDGGKWIGYFERLLIFLFVILNQYTGIGFLVAAKSILRFSEIKNDPDRKASEYIIIGSFASYLLAIIIGILAAVALV